MTLRDELESYIAGEDWGSYKVEEFLHAHGPALLEALADAERLDWLALSGASLRIESLHDEQTNGQPARWWVGCPVHTGIRSVDDKHRFTTFREAIDRARGGGEKGNG